MKDTDITQGKDAPASNVPLSNYEGSVGRRDWSVWPTYEKAVTGFRGFWYPVAWSNRIGRKPRQVILCSERIVLMRDGGNVFAIKDRCPHRGVPLSLGRQHFRGTVSCAYHGWTFNLSDGKLCAVITDGPDSPICGKVSVKIYPAQDRLGLVWVYMGDDDPFPLEAQLPEELVRESYVLGGRLDHRAGNWRLACENGYDEGHGKYLHRTSLWRVFKAMPAWNVTRISKSGRWIFRIQEKVHWEADFPGVGRWTNLRWWKLKPPRETFNLGNTGQARRVHPVIAAQGFPGFASVALPGILRIAYPKFIHYEFYVPTEENHHLYVGIMVSFLKGPSVLRFYIKYLGGIRWLFHGNFSRQDAKMVAATDAPPERLYRPDSSLIAWRRLCEEGTELAAGVPYRKRQVGEA